MKITLIGLQVGFLIVLQITSLVVLWVMSPITQSATDTFALYLSLDLIAFAILSYLYRSHRNSKPVNQGWVSIGYLALIILLVSNLALA